MTIGARPERASPPVPGPARPPVRPSGRGFARLQRLQARPFRLRLIDGVSLAAAGLLVLKLTAMLADGGEPGRLPEPGAELPPFARVLAQARTGYTPPDPTTTGSLAPRAEKGSGASAPAGEGAARDALAARAGGDGAEPASPTERMLLEKLAARRDSLRSRADELDLRERVLNEAERRLENGVADLRQGEDRADVGGARRSEAERGGLRNVVTMYETMKPKDAARVFDRLGLDVLVPLVLAMNPRKMAEVLAVMGPEPAEKLTVALANRARGVEAPAAPASPGLPPNELPALDPGPPTRPRLP